MKPDPEQMQLERAVGLPIAAGPQLRLWLRLRGTPLSYFLFQGAALVAVLLWTLPRWIPEIERYGIDIWVWRELMPDMLIVFTILVVLRASVDSGADMVKRPAWFLLMLTLAAMAALGLLIAIELVSEMDPELPSLHEAPLTVLANFCQNIIVVNAPFNWLAFLYMRHTDNQKKFALLLVARSLLARQVAQSRLLATRAQIDPKMVTRTLREVRMRYAADPANASALLDHLISYLRLAMNRVREKNPMFASECALIKSYLALREAETGVCINLEVISDGTQSQHRPLSLPLFLIVRRMFEEAARSLVSSVALRIGMHKDRISVELDCGAVAISERGIAHLSDELAELVDGDATILNHVFESGVNRYVVQAPIDCSIPYRIDR